MRTVMLRMLLLGVFLAGLSAGAAAQGAPDQIKDALEAFNQRLGTQFTLNDFLWTWEQQTFPDSHLGCPQPGVTAFQTSITGYRFLFTYAGDTYEYRVSADRTLTLFCGIVGEMPDTGPDVAGSIDDPRILSNSLCGAPPENVLYPRTRLAAGIEARVATASPVNLRTEPNNAAPLTAQIARGELIQVLNGPVCDAQGTLWVQVDYNGLTGYTPEALNTDYYLEPMPPSAEVPRDSALLTIANAATLHESGRLQGNFGPGLAWSAANILAVTGDSGAEGVWVYQPVGLASLPPRVIKSVDRFVRAAFATIPARRDTLLLGAGDGSVHIWSLDPASTLIERLVLNGHNSAVNAIAISPDGRYVASSGGYAYATTEDPLNENAILVWNIEDVTQMFALRGHTGAVTAVAFSPDGQTIASASLDGSVRLWNAASGEQTARIDSEVSATAMKYSPDGTLLVVGYQDGATLALSLVGGLSAGPVVATHSAPVNVVTFNPDGTLLASAAADGSLALRAGDRLLTSEQPVPITLQSPTIMIDLAFSPDGRILAALGIDKTVRLLISD